MTTSDRTIEMAKRVTPWIDKNPVFWLENLRLFLFGTTCSDHVKNQEIVVLNSVIRMLYAQGQIIPSEKKKGKLQYMKAEEHKDVFFDPFFKVKPKKKCSTSKF